MNVEVSVTQAPAEPHEEFQQELVSFCSLHAGAQFFGIDTTSIREVLGRRRVERVPLAPAYIEGIVPYRGEVLTAVSLRALLRIGTAVEVSQRPGCVLVLEDEKAVSEGHGHGSERFGLVVDVVGGVIMVDRRDIAANPSTLDEIGRALFSGAVRTEHGLMVQLDPHRLNPARLARSGLFSALFRKDAQRAEGEPICVP